MATRRHPIRPRDVVGGQKADAEISRDLVRALLDALSDTLLAGGVTAQQVAEIAKDAFVARAAQDAKMSTGRTNHSKVAVVTGLSRVEVRRRLAVAKGKPALPIRSLDRASRVIAGWRSDPLFLNRDGTPRDLPLTKARRSFAELVRRHSGDIPPRVVLDTMIARGLATRSNDAVSLVENSTPATRRSRTALAELNPLVTEMLGAATSAPSRLVYGHQLQLIAGSKSEEALLTEFVVEILSAASSAIASRRKPSKKRFAGDRSLSVNIALLAFEPRRTK